MKDGSPPRAAYPESGTEECKKCVRRLRAFSYDNQPRRRSACKLADPDLAERNRAMRWLRTLFAYWRRWNEVT
jgi:hypothetical protein